MLRHSLLLLLLLRPSWGDIGVDEDVDSFSISLDGVLLLEHTAERPLMALGLGTFEAVYNQGNYDITDDVDDIFELDLFQIGDVR